MRTCDKEQKKQKGENESFSNIPRQIFKQLEVAIPLVWLNYDVVFLCSNLNLRKITIIINLSLEECSTLSKALLCWDDILLQFSRITLFISRWSLQRQEPLRHHWCLKEYLFGSWYVITLMVHSQHALGFIN